MQRRLRLFIQTVDAGLNSLRHVRTVFPQPIQCISIRLRIRDCTVRAFQLFRTDPQCIRSELDHGLNLVPYQRSASKLQRIWTRQVAAFFISHCANSCSRAEQRCMNYVN